MQTTDNSIAAVYDTAKHQAGERAMNDNKELIHHFGVVARINGKLTKVVDARFYMSRSADGASPVYCNLWVSGADTYTSGRGKATGYGYHKTSAAFQDALDNAGFTLNRDIGGVGSDAMHNAALAMAQHIGADCAEALIV